MSELRTPRRAVAALFLWNGALLGAWASRIPALQREFDLSSGELGMLLLLLAGGAILGFPAAGALADRLGAAAIARWTAYAYGPALILIGLAGNVAALAAALLLFG